MEHGGVAHWVLCPTPMHHHSCAQPPVHHSSVLHLPMHHFPHAPLPPCTTPPCAGLVVPEWLPLHPAPEDSCGEGVIPFLCGKPEALQWDFSSLCLLFTRLKRLDRFCDLKDLIDLNMEFSSVPPSALPPFKNCTSAQWYHLPPVAAYPPLAGAGPTPELSARWEL